MGQCEACSKEGEYNAVDSDDLMQQLESTALGQDIAKLRADNRETLASCKFTPMPDKSFFKGRLKDTKRDGYGESYAGCFNYYGYFKNDLPHGLGAIITEHQCVLGNFHAGVLEGRGREWKSGIFFEGVYRKGERAEGKLTSDTYSYSGQFKNGLYHGKGTLILKDEFTYQGEFSEGKFEGQGTISFEGGCKFKGKIRNGLYEGYGEFTWPNGNFYRG
jgi:hypothetical protein